MAARHAQEREAVRDRRRLRADARHPRHRAAPRARAREPRRPGRARPLDRRRVHRDAVRRRQREPHLPADRQPPEGACPTVEVNYRDDGPRGRPRRSRPATTRACSPRSSRPSSPPSERGSREGRAGGRRPSRAAGGGMSGARDAAAAAAGDGGHGGGHEGGDERWLLTYADMITLLMALFIVMWAISSVNTTKFAELSVSLKQAFNGKLVDGGDEHPGGRAQPDAAAAALVGDAQGKPTATDPISVAPPSPSFDPITVDPTAQRHRQLQAARPPTSRTSSASSTSSTSGRATHGLKTKVATHDRRARARRPRAHRRPAVRQRQGVAQADRASRCSPRSRVHPRRVARRRTTSASRATPTTSRSRPPSSARNWELSAAARRPPCSRACCTTASAPSRLSATAYADQRPLAANGSATGRSTNRRVELVVLRRAASGPEGATP